MRRVCIVQLSCMFGVSCVGIGTLWYVLTAAVQVLLLCATEQYYSEQAQPDCFVQQLLCRVLVVLSMLIVLSATFLHCSSGPMCCAHAVADNSNQAAGGRDPHPVWALAVWQGGV